MIPVTVDNVVKLFGRTRALDSVTLRIDRGELFFLLGPSGCGKTTLLRSIAGFYTPESGRIFFGDVDVTHVPPQRRDTGMVFQNYALWPHLTVEANVAFGLSVRRVGRSERKRRVTEALETVRMGQYSRRKPNQLSGGQQQRIALARALVIRPRCLLLDEPLSNLDAKLRLEMRCEIRRLCKEAGLTAIYVTHDQKEALTIADRMAVMFDGKIAQLGTPRELYRHPADARIADFLGETNFLNVTVRSQEGGAALLDSPIGPLRAENLNGSAASGACVASIRPEAIVVCVGGAGVSVSGGTGVSASGGTGVSPVRTSTGTGETPIPPGNVAPINPAANRVSAKVVDVLYLGEAVQLTLAAGTATLRANLTESAASASPTAGQMVTCEIDPRDVVVLKG
ncbi:Spermidine/putrescine import ATP-binding protein PotA [Phycisphaerae bacterium RAS1]|nr:Spermidine/putrescine import ATP-binding protein PotA [Phycisphaerae bacterium RAS1]